MTSNMPEKAAMHLFTEMLRDITKELQQYQSERLPIEHLRKLKSIFDEVLISAKEYEEKRKACIARL